ncbi:AraC family transcriptional regulator [Paenibacillus pectinilyticus]|uniref:AraC family transcriptional regulator n=1 Tax=Paenibacillus pectinilyticus TaxID=512399 RepID=A0A1C0ZXU8_9BACL|nr:helix-turn-helix domain-containing protein [Paenibacillus pectinilyticus]OCT12927.1 AraC family transcriptional regulator [Paenibacillus pectinilyticus]
MTLHTNQLIAGHFIEPDTYWVKRPHGQNDWLVMFTLEGAGFVYHQGVERVCTKGDIILLAPGTPHHYGTVKHHTWQFVWTHFPNMLTETSLLPQEDQVFLTIENESLQERIYQAFSRILADSRERGEYWFELCCNAIREILLLMAQKTIHKMDPRIEEVLHLLSQMMREDIRIEELAQTVGLSPSRLSHLFKESTGLSIIDTLNRMRIQQAALMLSYTGRSASEVCYDVGFQNYNHFTNQFRKWQGMTPSMFMKEHRTTDATSSAAKS